MPEETKPEVIEAEIVIIGGGPAGLSAAVYAGRSARKVMLLEKGLVGGQVAMTMDIANYPGFPEGINGTELAQKMRAQAERYGVEFCTAEAKTINKDGDTFTVETSKLQVRAKAVIIATGSQPLELGVEGENELRGRGVSYCGTCDAPFFRDKRVLVVGGGDTALKEALHLSKFVSELTLIHRRDSFKAEMIYQKQILSNEKIKILYNTELKKITGEKKVQKVALYDNKNNVESEFEVDGVFIFIGTKPNTRLVCQLVPANCGGNIDTDLDMMTEIEGLFAVGDVREHSYRQVATAVGEGATAAMAAEHLLQERA